MQTNFDDEESSTKFVPGKRYTLFIADAKGGTNKNGTPYLKLDFKTPDNETAYDIMLYLSNKALFRVKPWYKAMGLKTDGLVDFDESKLINSRISVECYLESYTVNEGQADEREMQITKWHKPERVEIGSDGAGAGQGNEQAGASEQEQSGKTPAGTEQSSGADESVPF